MLTKSKLTTQYIINIVAPIFNKKGYAATSMSDITKATGLSKGAIYGNFKNKEELAIAAFKKNVNDVLKKVAIHQERSSSPLQKIYLIIDFYKNYYEFSKELGGCPILNIGVDANHQNTALLEEVKKVIHKSQHHISKLVLWGIETGEIKKSTNSNHFAKKLYAEIQGAIFMTYTMDDLSYMNQSMEELENYIKTKISI